MNLKNKRCIYLRKKKKLFKNGNDDNETKNIPQYDNKSLILCIVVEIKLKQLVEK